MQADDSIDADPLDACRIIRNNNYVSGEAPDIVSVPVRNAMTKGNIESVAQEERGAAPAYQQAMEKIKDEGARAYKQARIDYCKKGGEPPGTLLDWLKGHGFL